MYKFSVQLFPVGLYTEVWAGDCMLAAELANEALGPANEVLVERCDIPFAERFQAQFPGEPDGLRVIFKPRPAAVHFIGLRTDSEWHSAVRIWGQPDFVHVGYDSRTHREIAQGDLLVFGSKADPDFVSPYTYDDSNEADDPAAAERSG